MPEYWFMYLLGFALPVILGLCFGSFATAMIARIPAGESWIGSTSKPERSACPHCNHKLGVFDLVPLFSWLFLRGKCRYCRHPIGISYPLIELATMLLCVAFWFGSSGWLGGSGSVYESAGIMLLMIASPFIVAMLVIDLKHMILPNDLQIILYLIGLVFVWFERSGMSGIGHALLSSLIYGGLAWALAVGGRFFLKRDALGMGDVKFFAVAGLWLGVMALPAFLMLGGVMGVVFGLIWKYVVKQERFPFGPALIVAFLLLLLLQSSGFISVLGPFLGGIPGLS